MKKILIAIVLVLAGAGVLTGTALASTPAKPAVHRQLVFQVTIPAEGTTPEHSITEVCAFQSQTSRNTFYACAYQTKG